MDEEAVLQHFDEAFDKLLDALQKANDAAGTLLEARRTVLEIPHAKDTGHGDTPLDSPEMERHGPGGQG